MNAPKGAFFVYVKFNTQVFYIMGTKHKKDDESIDSYNSYFEYNKILRTWFVAFGIGGPALILVNDNIAAKLAAQGELKIVAILFLIGAISQVLGAFINKIANWYVYISYAESTNPSTFIFKFSNWLIEQFWIDIFLDIVTILCFGAAVWHLLTIFSAH